MEGPVVDLVVDLVEGPMGREEVALHNYEAYDRFSIVSMVPCIQIINL